MQEYQRKLLQICNVDVESTMSQLNSGSYYMRKKDLKENAEKLKKMIVNNGPELLLSGFGTLQADHKYIKNKTAEDQKNGLAVIFIISRDNIYKSILLDIVAVSTTEKEQTRSEFHSILEVQFYQSDSMN